MKIGLNIADTFYNTSSSGIRLFFKTEDGWDFRVKEDFENDVLCLARQLKRLGVKKGDRVAILSKNRPEWATADLAILLLGAVSVPIYETLTGDQIRYIVEHSGSKVFFIEDENLIETNEVLLMELIDEKLIENLIVFEPCRKKLLVEALDYEDLVEEASDEDMSDLIKNSASLDDLATIIYTSGTTGEPKGVMLSHRNLLENCDSMDRVLDLSEEDVFLSFLPPAHIFARNPCGFYMYFKGLDVYYAESIEKLVDNLAVSQPTVLAGVPRVYEKVYNKIMSSKNSGGKVKQTIFDWAHNVGSKVFEKRIKGLKISKILQAKYSLAHKLVFKKIHKTFGGKIRLMISGGAPLAAVYIKFFHAIGLPIYEAYGLSETSPAVTVNTPEAFKLGSVGKAVPNVEIKIVPNDQIEPGPNNEVSGEILVRGSNVMKGYYKKEDITNSVIDADGWFHTGDAGYIDEDGFLFITDRIKELLKTAGGKYIAPAPIEQKLKQCSAIDQICLIADTRKFASALIVPSEEICESEAIDLIDQSINDLNKGLARFETIKKYRILKQPFSLETGELTPTLKLKRRVINQKFQTEIDEMYQENAADQCRSINI